MEETFQSPHSPSQHTFTEAKHQKTQAFFPNLFPPEDLLTSLSLKHKQPDLPKIPGVWKSEPLMFHLPVELLTIAKPALHVSGQLVLGHSLSAAWAPPKAVPFVTVRQQVLRQAGDLQHLQHSHKVCAEQTQMAFSTSASPSKNEKRKILFQSTY